MPPKKSQAGDVCASASSPSPFQFSPILARVLVNLESSDVRAKKTCFCCGPETEQVLSELKETVLGIREGILKDISVDAEVKQVLGLLKRLSIMPSVLMGEKTADGYVATLRNWFAIEAVDGEISKRLADVPTVQKLCRTIIQNIGSLNTLWQQVKSLDFFCQWLSARKKFLELRKLPEVYQPGENESHALALYAGLQEKKLVLDDMEMQIRCAAVSPWVVQQGTVVLATLGGMISSYSGALNQLDVSSRKVEIERLKYIVKCAETIFKYLRDDGEGRKLLLAQVSLLESVQSPWDQISCSVYELEARAEEASRERVMRLFYVGDRKPEESCKLYLVGSYLDASEMGGKRGQKVAGYLDELGEDFKIPPISVFAQNEATFNGVVEQLRQALGRGTERSRISFAVDRLNLSSVLDRMVMLLGFQIRELHTIIDSPNFSGEIILPDSLHVGAMLLDQAIKYVSGVIAKITNSAKFGKMEEDDIVKTIIEGERRLVEDAPAVRVEEVAVDVPVPKPEEVRPPEVRPLDSPSPRTYSRFDFATGAKLDSDQEEKIKELIASCKKYRETKKVRGPLEEQRLLECLVEVCKGSEICKRGIFAKLFGIVGCSIDQDSELATKIREFLDPTLAAVVKMPSSGGLSA